MGVVLFVCGLVFIFLFIMGLGDEERAAEKRNNLSLIKKNEPGDDRLMPGIYNLYWKCKKCGAIWPTRGISYSTLCPNRCNQDVLDKWAWNRWDGWIRKDKLEKKNQKYHRNSF